MDFKGYFGEVFRALADVDSTFDGVYVLIEKTAGVPALERQAGRSGKLPQGGR
jgi:hypothetical protein